MRELVQRIAVMIALMGSMAISPLVASAQDVTGSTPGAEDCTVDPRTEEEILAVAAAATPVTSDSYEEALEARRLEWEGVTVLGPADFETQQAIRDTTWQILACVNADMFVHLHSLYSDDLIRESQPTLEQLRGDDPTDAIVDGQVVEQGPVSLIDILAIQELSNGKVSTIVVIDSPEIVLPIEAFAYYFEEVNGRWLLDGAAL